MWCESLLQFSIKIIIDATNPLTVNIINHNKIQMTIHSIQEVHIINTPDSHWATNEKYKGRPLTVFFSPSEHFITDVASLSFKHCVFQRNLNRLLVSGYQVYSPVLTYTTQALCVFCVFGEVSTSFWNLTGDSGTCAELQSPYCVTDL